MPDIKEDVLVSIQLEQDEGAFKKLADLKNVLIENKKAQNQLNEDFRKGRITSKEYASDIVRLDANHKKLNAEYSTTQRSVTGLKNPFDRLNESTLKQSGLIEKLIPGFGSASTAMQSASTTAKGLTLAEYALLAPLALIGAALLALTAYFKGSEEGQDKLAKVMAVGKVVFDSVLVVVEKLGEALFSIGEVVASGVGAVIDFFAPRVGKLLSDTIKSGAAIADLLDMIEANENALIVKRAETDRRVSELREKAIQSEGAQKRAFVEEAIKLEKQLAAEELKQANLKLSHFEREAKSSGRLTEEQKKQRAELTATIIEKEAQAFDATRKFQKELEKLKDEEVKKNDERRKLDAENEAIDRANRHASSREADEIELADLSTRQETELEIRGTFDQAIVSASESIKNTILSHNKEKIAADAEVLKAKKEFVNAELGVVQILSTGLSQLANKSKALAIAAIIVQKAAAIGNIISNIFVANAKAIAASPLTFGQPWVAVNSIAGGIAVAGAVSSGADAIGQINSAKGFASSGITGTKINSTHGKRINRSNGDNLLATVKIGEVILNERHQAMLGGDDTFKRIGVPGFANSGLVSSSNLGVGNDSSVLRDIVNKINTIQTVLVVERFEEVQGRKIEVKERATF